MKLKNDEWPKSSVRKLWFAYREGKSYSGIASCVGRTRDAVAGKLLRLRVSDPTRWGVRPRIWPTRGHSPRARIQLRLPAFDASISEEMESMFKVDVPKLPLLQLRDKQCRWPIGEVGQKGFRFCKAETPDGCSYCARHMQIATAAPASVRRERPALRA